MEKRIYKNSISISIGIHILLLVAALLLEKLAEQSRILEPQKELVWIEVEPNTKKRQIVDSTAGKEVEKAKPDAFLGEKNRIVDEQMVGKLQDQHTGQPKTKTKQKQGQDKTEKKVTLNKLGLAMFRTMDQGQDLKRPENWAEQGLYQEDYVPGIRESERTALNTKEYVYFGYFQRIRERLDRAWRPILRDHLYRIFTKGRRLASDKDHTTKTLVTLDKKGHIVRIEVLEDSGQRDLDAAAVKAFNKAGPFPNPPTGLVEAEGTIKIRWDFILRT